MKTTEELKAKLHARILQLRERVEPTIASKIEREICERKVIEIPAIIADREETHFEEMLDKLKRWRELFACDSENGAQCDRYLCHRNVCSGDRRLCIETRQLLAKLEGE